MFSNCGKARQQFWTRYLPEIRRKQSTCRSKSRQLDVSEVSNIAWLTQVFFRVAAYKKPPSLLSSTTKVIHCFQGAYKGTNSTWTQGFFVIFAVCLGLVSTTHRVGFVISATWQSGLTEEDLFQNIQKYTCLKSDTIGMTLTMTACCSADYVPSQMMNFWTWKRDAINSTGFWNAKLSWGSSSSSVSLSTPSATWWSNSMR